MRHQVAFGVAAAIVVGLSLTTGGCAPEAEVLPPLGEAVIIVDTDAPVPGLVSNLRIDLYALDGTWLRSLDVPRADVAGWPLSFSVFTPDENRGRELLVRLRAFPDNKVRDYRGERFVPVPVPVRAPPPEDEGAGVAAASCELPVEAADALGDGPEDPDDGSPQQAPRRLFRRDESGALVRDENGALEDVTPLFEPLPDLTIDRLLRVRLEPGVSGGIPVVLRGACFGFEADLFDDGNGLRTCIDTAQEYVAVETMVGREATTLPPSQANTWPPAAPCAAPVGPDEVCVDGGAFILGDLTVFGFQGFDAAPERVAVLPPLVADKFEVTVGAFRAWWDAQPSPPAVGDPSDPRCNWTETPGDAEEQALNCVPWETARAYCRDQGGDLPTEAQWEWFAAASGNRTPRQTRFPFGNSIVDCDVGIHARANDVSEGATECNALGTGPQPAREAAGSATPGEGDITPPGDPEGLVGMGGNVREWVLDAHAPYCSACWAATTWDDPSCDPDLLTARTARGGDWAVSSQLMLSALRDIRLTTDPTLPDERVLQSPRVGFRCVRPGRAP
ncbi:MAG: SUMF1/EgtB/PvdO family nonheme iron enzyme [Myxococcota bacterium]